MHSVELCSPSIKVFFVGKHTENYLWKMLSGQINVNQQNTSGDGNNFF